jgi:glycerol uptake facilitator-like aquaporin
VSFSSVNLPRRLLGELIGSSFLSAVVIGSGIAAKQLSPGNVGLELLENALVTGAGLYTLILIFGPLSGAHFNPVVSIVNAATGGMSWFAAGLYVPVQVVGCILGALGANVMFSLRVLSISTHHRASGPHLFAEAVATTGLILVIFALSRNGHHAHTPAAVGAYIAAAYFFTSSTSFANPAIAVGRIFSNTFAGIAPASVPGFILAELVGGGVALVLVLYLFPTLREPS